MKILIADNDRPLAYFLCGALMGEGYEVDTASTGRHALELLKEFPYDLLILEMLLPDQHGLQVLQRLYKIKPAVRVIVVSRCVDARVKMAALAMGVLGYTTKPFSIAVLAGQLANLSRIRACKATLNTTRRMLGSRTIPHVKRCARPPDKPNCTRSVSSTSISECLRVATSTVEGPGATTKRSNAKTKANTKKKDN